MSKISLAVVCALMVSMGSAKCADSTFLNPEALYRIWFAPEYMTVHNLDPNSDSLNQYVVKVDEVNKQNPNWILIEFPQAPNQAYNSGMAGKRWINLNYVIEMRTYTPPPGQ